jgi:integrase
MSNSKNSTRRRGHSKALPSYRKHRKSGQAIVTLSGKDHYLGPHGTKASRAEYDRLIGEWLANGRRSPNQSVETAITVETLLADYWRWAKTYYVKNGKASGEQSSIKIAIRDTRRLYASTSVDDFGPLALEAIRGEMLKRDASRGYINAQIKRIRRIFKWGVAKQKVPPMVLHALQALDGLKAGKCKARETGPVLPIGDAVIDTTIKHCRKVLAAMIQFQRLTGCRPGEVFNIKPKELDRSGSVWIYRPSTHKMEHKGRDRVILIGPKAQEILRPYLLRDENKFCFLRHCGKPYKRWHYSNQINTACDRAFPAPPSVKNVPAKLKSWKKKHRWAPNRLRHSAATAIRQEFGLEAAQVILGHASADVTQVYAERDQAKAVEVMAKIG